MVSPGVNWTHEAVVNLGVCSLFTVLIRWVRVSVFVSPLPFSLPLSLSLIPRRHPAGGSTVRSLGLNEETRGDVAVGYMGVFVGFWVAAVEEQGKTHLCM